MTNAPSRTLSEKVRFIYIKYQGLAESVFVLLISALLFGMTVGFEVLPLGAVSWMLVQEDPSNHLMGWLYFQASPWTWPLGHTPLMLSPTGGSIASTDSIPLWAYFFKIFRDFLPYPSQYFGLALFTGYFLLGFFTHLYLKRNSSAGLAARMIAVALVLCSPAFFNRLTAATAHIALTNHFLILWALWVWSRPRESELSWNQILGLNFAVLIASMIHPFLWIIVISIQLPLAMLFSIRNRKWGIAVSSFALSGLLSPFFLSMGGLFESGGSMKSFGFGTYSSNLLTFFDPNQFSRILPDIPSKMGQWEGMAYLGLGAMGLLGIALALKIRSWKNKPSVSFSSPSLWVWLWAAALGIFALSDKIVFSETTLLDLTSLYEPIDFITGPLRSSGRLIWPLYYLTLIASLTLALNWRKRITVGILAAALALQIADTLPFDNSPIQTWTETPPVSFHSSDDFHGIGLVRIFPPFAAYEKEIPECFLSPMIPYQAYLSLGIEAASLRIPVNSGIASRFSSDALAKECRETRAILEGFQKETVPTLYVLNSRVQVTGSHLKCKTRGPLNLCRAQ